LKIEPSIRLITIKLQYNNFDEGEFTEEQPIDYASFLEIFDKEANDRFDTKYSWTINNNYIKYFINGDNAHYTVIEHLGKEVYSFTYFNKIDKYAYGNNFYYNTIIELCKLYFENDFSALKQELGKSEKKATKLINFFTQHSLTYSFKHKKYFSLIIGSFYPLMGCAILFNELIFRNRVNVLLLIFSILLFTIYFFLIKLHLNHLKESKNKSITISSGNDNIKVNIEDIEIKFVKSDIKKLIVVNSTSFRNPFAEYEYTQIILNNDSIINITDMIIDTYLMEKKLKGVEKEKKATGYAYIKPRTNFTVN
jgi:hypothetical protein